MKARSVMKRVLRIVLLIICIVVFIFSAVSLGRYALDTWRTVRDFNDLAGMVKDDTVTIPDLDSDTEDIDESARMMAKYGDLYDLNRDFIGWLSIDGTNIDYPVMYTPYDPEYYLHRNFYGETDSSGTLFADYRCSFNPDSTNIIIYGHHMRSGTMFGRLVDFKDEDYLEAHSTITFDTIYRSGTYEIFAAFLSKAYDIDDDVFKYYDFINAYSAEEYYDYLANIKAISLYYNDSIAPEYGTGLLTLSTCDYTQDDGRFVLLARRVN